MRPGRSVSPRAGQRRRATAAVLSPLARQIAALGLALCAVALSLAYPLRNYLQQQAAEQAAVAQQHQLEQQVADLKAQQEALTDPAYIRAEAKRRLQYVTPGDTVYVIKVPAALASSSTAPSVASPGTVPVGASTEASGPAASGSPAPGGGASPTASGSSIGGTSATNAPTGTSTGTPAAGAAAGTGARTTDPDGTAGQPAAGTAGVAADEPWYASMWDTLSGNGGAAAGPTG